MKVVVISSGFRCVIVKGKRVMTMKRETYQAVAHVSGIMRLVNLEEIVHIVADQCCFPLLPFLDTARLETIYSRPVSTVGVHFFVFEKRTLPSMIN
jgi:hypothetical protein